MRGHSPIVIEHFMGLWDRSSTASGAFGAGYQDDCPQDHSIEHTNFVFNNKGTRTRPGMTMVQSNVTGAGLLRKHTFQFSGGDRDLVMDATRRLIDRQTAAVLVTGPIGSDDFCLINLFNRAYISFFNKATGLGISGSSIYVYDGTTIRTAGGTAPVGAITSGGAIAGKIEVGLHAYAVAFETASGFITQAGGFVALNSTAPQQITLATIPVGPAGTVARHILATKVAYTGWNLGDWKAIEFFFVPNGKINDNVTTTLAVSFYDADLVASADYLLDELITIPACSSMAELNGKLCLAGFPSPDGSLVRISKSGQPESFSSIDGFVIVRPGDGGDVKALTSHRDALMILKDSRSSLVRDEKTPPAFWTPIPIDNSIGTPSCNGISKVPDVNGPSVDYFLVASRTGLEKYSGSYDARPLTWKISAIWNRITATFFHSIQVIDNTKDKHIYIRIPYNGTLHILFADYSEGLDWQNIKWSFWELSLAPVTISARLDTATKTILVEFMDSDSNLIKFDALKGSDINAANAPVAIRTAFISAFLPTENNGELNHFVGLRTRLIGVGQESIATVLYQLDYVTSWTIPSIPLQIFPGKMVKSEPFNVTTERVAIYMLSNAIDKVFELRRLALFVRLATNLNSPNV